MLESLSNENGEDLLIQDIFASSSDSSSDEFEFDVIKEVINIHKPRKKQKRKREKHSCKKIILEMMQDYTDKDFLRYFRMNRETVKHLISGYKKSTVYLDLIKNDNSRSFQLTPEKTILAFLWYAGHHFSSFRDVADKFHICVTTLHMIITRVCDYLESIADEYLHFPSQEEMIATKEYYSRKGIPNVIGSIDCFHIKIDKPQDRYNEFFNQKYHSIAIQGVCNHQKQFIDVSVGFPGSQSDVSIFRSSSLFEKLEQTQNDFYLLGDSAYPTTPYLITPYQNNGKLTKDQEEFNKTLNSCRADIELTFQLLQQRFEQLYHLKLRGQERICKFIRACCVLHNMGAMDDFDTLNSKQLLCFHAEQPAHVNIPEDATAHLIRDQFHQVIKDIEP